MVLYLKLQNQTVILLYLMRKANDKDSIKKYTNFE